jgi:hypothetical protein
MRHPCAWILLLKAGCLVAPLGRRYRSTTKEKATSFDGSATKPVGEP